ncbi:MAG: hypothetical protein KGZ60_04940 [Truepera sp.]|nr:hypothetical protein [Truepera sp.]
MIGKVNEDFFTRAILPHTGAPSRRLIIGPRMGVDAAVIKTAEGYMAIAEDPIFPSPGMTPEEFGWVTVHIGASDVAVMGVKPEFLTYTLLLPPGTPEEYIARLVKGISDSAQDLGITVAGGHTGFYKAVTVPTIGGITVWGNADQIITPAGAKTGDDVVITKGAGIEAAALLAMEFGEDLKSRGVAPDLVQKAAGRFGEITVVKDALTAAGVDGVHAMHDATEGGLARGLWEVAEASGVGLEISTDIPVPPDIAAVCRHFGLDPLEVISEGTLIITCATGSTHPLIQTLADAGIEAALIGKVVTLGEGRNWVTPDGRRESIVPPPIDQFWELYFDALSLRADRRTPEERELCAAVKQGGERLIDANVWRLIPEVGANLALAAQAARTPADVAAVPGRLLRMKNAVAMLGEPEMGCSQHMAATLLTLREYLPEVRCVINLRNDDGVRKALSELKWRVLHMKEPVNGRQSAANWDRDLRELLNGVQGIPDVIEIPDRVNLERLILVLGRNVNEVIGKTIDLNRRVQSMA